MTPDRRCGVGRRVEDRERSGWDRRARCLFESFPRHQPDCDAWGYGDCTCHPAEVSA